MSKAIRVTLSAKEIKAIKEWQDRLAPATKK
jgi:hypothetical protein